MPAARSNSSCDCQLCVWRGLPADSPGCQEGHLCADQCVLRTGCFGRSRSLDLVACGLKVMRRHLTAPPHVCTQLTPSVKAPGGAVSGQFAKRSGRGGRAAVKQKGSISTHPQLERGSFDILTSPRPEAGTGCSGASNLPLTA